MAMRMRLEVGNLLAGASSPFPHRFNRLMTAQTSHPATSHPFPHVARDSTPGPNARSRPRRLKGSEEWYPSLPTPRRDLRICALAACLHGLTCLVDQAGNAAGDRATSCKQGARRVPSHRTSLDPERLLGLVGHLVSRCSQPLPREGQWATAFVFRGLAPCYSECFFCLFYSCFLDLLVVLGCETSCAPTPPRHTRASAKRHSPPSFTPTEATYISGSTLFRCPLLVLTSTSQTIR
jgi:hypothetical protein